MRHGRFDGGMRLLVLGGTAFLSRAVAEEAVRSGHEVTCACRGSAPPPAGVRHLPFDRTVTDAADVLDDAYDAVVDVATRPSWVRSAVAATQNAHWVYVSTISVYADATMHGGRPETLPVLDPVTEDVDLAAHLEAYGGMKVACEDAVRATAASSVVVRPGLIVGPGDRSGRFTYWPTRLADPGPVLVPAPADAPVQVVDVRDLGAWLVRCAEERLTGTRDGVGEVLDWGAFVAQVAEGVGSSPELVWVDEARLLELGVEPWAGPGSLPLWLPQELAGTMAHDPEPPRAAGLVCRPLAETARDTLAWARSDPSVRVGGLTRAEEQELLRLAEAG
jgi:nucleoside-diphosphate-sugar epimerase